MAKKKANGKKIRKLEKQLANSATLSVLYVVASIQKRKLQLRQS